MVKSWFPLHLLSMCLFLCPSWKVLEIRPTSNTTLNKSYCELHHENTANFQSFFFFHNITYKKSNATKIVNHQTVDLCAALRILPSGLLSSTLFLYSLKICTNYHKATFIQTITKKIMHKLKLKLHSLSIQFATYTQYKIYFRRQNRCVSVCLFLSSFTCIGCCYCCIFNCELLMQYVIVDIVIDVVAVAVFLNKWLHNTLTILVFMLYCISFECRPSVMHST